MVNKRVRNAVLGYNLKNNRMISVCFQSKPFNITVIQLYAPTSDAEEDKVEWFYGTTDWFQIGKGVRQGCILLPCLFNLYAETLGWKKHKQKHKLESRLLGEISITSDMQMTPPLWQKVKRNSKAS